MAERWVDRGDGVLQLIAADGSVIATQKPNKSGRARIQDKRTHHFILDGIGRKIWVPRGTNPDSLSHKAYPQSDITWQYVCQYIMEGKTLEQIGKMEEMPPVAVLWHWRNQNPEYQRLYVEAKKARAEYRADKALSIADDKDISEKDVPGRRLRADLLRWGAEMDDRQTFGKQTKVVGDSSQPVVFQVSTGVPDPQPGQEQPVLSGPPPIDVVSMTEDADEHEG